jgi:hypothetical protein
MGTLKYSQVRPAVAQSDLTTIAPYMFWLMFRNIASDGFVFEDPVNTDVLSQPGCVLASPAWENTATNVSQDYVYTWTRDAAIAAIELAAGPLPTTQPLIDYVQFAQTCQNSASSIGHFDRASFLINGGRGVMRVRAGRPGDPDHGRIEQEGEAVQKLPAHVEELGQRLGGRGGVEAGGVDDGEGFGSRGVDEGEDKSVA